MDGPKVFISAIYSSIPPLIQILCMCCSTNGKSILTIQLTATIKAPKVLQIRIQFSIPLRNFSFKTSRKQQTHYEKI